ncbi:uncharacterized protein LOC123562012 [Mercenaria mercenaria]|uniref:uncharacterized protein LOC123562012 n=1 Tax=Mercenaria mercenaria TaxID=6596 RepID=UPI00234E8FD4|nr:uncharacterized protein LOC123562012 [Mercenaria mercenaria]
MPSRKPELEVQSESGSEDETVPFISNASLQDVRQGKFKIIYMHPETVFNKEVGRMMRNSRFRYLVCCTVVDEVHMISEWGTEFRKCFEPLGELTCLFPNIPQLALTAKMMQQLVAPPELLNDLVCLYADTSSDGCICSNNEQPCTQACECKGCVEEETEICQNLFTMLASIDRIHGDIIQNPKMLSASQALFYTHASSGHNIVLTGQGGSGKSFVLNNFARDMQLPGNNHVYVATEEGDSYYLNRFQAPKRLGLKFGCPVMLVVNLSETLDLFSPLDISSENESVDSSTDEISDVEFFSENSDDDYNTTFSSGQSLPTCDFVLTPVVFSSSTEACQIEKNTPVTSSQTENFDKQKLQVRGKGKWKESKSGQETTQSKRKRTQRDDDVEESDNVCLENFPSCPPEEEINQHVKDREENGSKTAEKVKENTDKANAKLQRDFRKANERKQNYVDLKVGDKVLKFNSARAGRKSEGDLDANYSGPYTIIEVIGHRLKLKTWMGKFLKALCQ